MTTPAGTVSPLIFTRPGLTRPATDSDSLARELASRVHGEVRFDRGARALYSTDASNYRQTPIGVVIPRDAADVEAAVAVCRTHDVPIFGRGGATSLAGQCCNVAVCFDFSKYMNRVLEIDSARRLGRVQPGTILDDLRHAAEAEELTFGPDPATHTHCTLGGMTGNDSCGIHSVMAAFAGTGPRTADNIDSLDVLTYDGLRVRVGPTPHEELTRIIRAGGRRGEIYLQLKHFVDRHGDAIRRGFPRIPRRVSGFNLPYLLPERGFNVARALVGSESTCVLLLEIVTNLIPNPRARTLLVLGYPDVYHAGDHVPEIMAHRPIGLEGIDDRLVDDMRKAGIHTKHQGMLPKGGGWLLVEFGGDSRAESDARADALASALRAAPAPPSIKRFDDPDEEKQVWKIRESGLGATAHVSQERPTWPGWEDSAVPPDRVGEYLRKLRALLDTYGYACSLYGHLGQGCVHTSIDFDLVTVRGIEQYRSFVEKAADLVVSLGGSLSGEHGDGQSRAELLPRMFGPELIAAFREFKAIWDPRGRMNPGKVVDPAPLDSHLRLGTNYRPPDLQTHFQFPDDSRSFAKATLRCVGAGECRRLDGGTMCPSFMVTREEQHSTRGRARLLFEMIEGDPLKDSWQDENVKNALDLCLACKGCKGDCPVKVDMATYKAEFLSHYYEQHRRPVHALAFGLVHYWARLGSLMPDVANAVTHTPGLAQIAKVISGMALPRQVPIFAPQTFQQWFAHHRARRGLDRGNVVLWPDTFNNHFHPQTAIHAARTLERAGFRVHVPRAAVCCGRPLYDYGMLDTAKTWLRHATSTLAADINQGTPVVGLEPSCVAVFRDELPQLLPNDPLAMRVSRQVFTLGEFLNTQEVRYPVLHRRAVVHGHCHHKAIMKFDDEEQALRSMGLDVEVLDAGCCGMAGSFGFERDHYNISMAIGERALLPALRRAARDTLIVADGFSCRTQIAGATGRRGLHLADVLEMAACEGPRGPTGDFPEHTYVPQYAAPRPSRVALWAGGLIGAAAFVSMIGRGLRE